LEGRRRLIQFQFLRANVQQTIKISKDLFFLSLQMLQKVKMTKLFSNKISRRRLFLKTEGIKIVIEELKERERLNPPEI
jgi:hypothetical protein